MNDTINLFEKASRRKLRFDTPKGLLSVEDLWDLPLTSTTGRANLDDIAKGLYQQVKAGADEISFVTPAAKADDSTQVGFELVKYIISVRVAERDAATAAAAKREQKQKLLALIDQKENAALADRSLDELKAMVEQL